MGRKNAEKSADFLWFDHLRKKGVKKRNKDFFFVFENEKLFTLICLTKKKKQFDSLLFVEPRKKHHILK